MIKSSRPPKIGILGPFGGGNLGDAATQQAMIENIRIHWSEAEIHGFSLNPWDTETRHGIPSFLMARLPVGVGAVSPRLPSTIRELVKHNHIASILFRQFLRAIAIPREVGLIIDSFRYIKEFDSLIISGSGQLLDYWWGPFFQPYSLLKWALLARLRGAKVLFVSVGAGPIDARLSKLFIRLALSLASYRSYRDEKAKKFIDLIGFHKDDPVYPDLAFSLSIATTTTIQSIATLSRRPIIGINPMTYCDPRIWPERDINVYNVYLAKLAQFTVWLVKRGHEIVLFPGEAVHDRFVIDDLVDLLAKELNQHEMERVTHPPITTVHELIDLLSKTDMVIASRFHGVVLAQLLYKPVLALTYHSKTEEVMANAGQGEFSIRISECNIERLIERFEALEMNAPFIREQLRSKVREYQLALEEQYKRLFTNIGASVRLTKPTVDANKGGLGVENA